MSEGRGHPSEIREDMKAARRLEFWNIGWTLTYVAALGLAMGSSQAMRTAWIEDLLGLIPPILIGRKELPLAVQLRDKLIHTDALMNKANWQTGVAGFLGVALLGFGLWWADAVAAAIISFSIILDGWRALKIAIAELNDGVPHELEGGHRAKDAKAIEKALKAEFPGSKVLLRETGRYIRAEVVGAVPPKGFDFRKLDIPDLDCRWRLDSIAFRP